MTGSTGALEFRGGGSVAGHLVAAPVRIGPKGTSGEGSQDPFDFRPAATLTLRIRGTIWAAGSFSTMGPGEEARFRRETLSAPAKTIRGSPRRFRWRKFAKTCACRTLPYRLCPRGTSGGIASCVRSEGDRFDWCAGIPWRRVGGGTSRRRARSDRAERHLRRG